jgi:biotin carboxyl carrier protein
MKYQISLHNHSFELDHQDGKIQIGGAEFENHTIQSTADSITIKLNHKIFHIQHIQTDEDGKTMNVRINGKKVLVTVKSEMDLRIEKMGGNSAVAASLKNVKAPMPGLIVKMHIQVGDVVEKGQVLLNFEAMKMENQLKSPGSGVIKNILIEPGSKVEKGQLLIELE